MNLTKVKEIQLAINSLSPEEARYLHHWLSQKDWTDWEQQIEQDAQAGKLDFLIDEAFYWWTHPRPHDFFDLVSIKRRKKKEGGRWCVQFT